MTTATINFFGGLFLHKKASINTRKKESNFYRELNNIKSSLIGIINIKEENVSEVISTSSEVKKIPIILVKKNDGEVKVNFVTGFMDVDLKNAIDLR